MIIDHLNANFVVLRTLNGQHVHWTRHIPGHKPQLMISGVLEFEVVAYTLTSEEAQAIWALKVPKFLLRESQKHLTDEQLVRLMA